MSKKLLTILLAFVMAVVFMPVVGTQKVYATDMTADQAIEWAKSKVGTSVGVDDGSGYFQCVEFIQAYYEYLGVSPVDGSAYQYATNKLPDGWTRTPGGIPQKGDILIYSQYSSSVQQYGHVAIYESDDSLYDQDGSVKGATVKHESKNYRSYTYNYWGCIHPKFLDNVVGKTSYDKVFKIGKTVYCCGRSGLYKVTLKNNKPAKVKRLVKFNGVFCGRAMIKKGNYIYYFTTDTGVGGTVMRVNIITGKRTRLTEYLDEGDYTISGDTLYYSKIVWPDYDDYYEDDEDYEDDYEYTEPYNEIYAATLAGKSPHLVNITFKSKIKKTNSKYYSVKTKYTNKYVYDYLKTPRGKFFIGKSKRSSYF